MIRVAMDVTPLVQTRAGTARYIRGLLREFQEGNDVRVRACSFGGSARVWNIPRDAVWYPAILGARRIAADVLHCPTYRGPVRSHLPLVVTVHDVAVFRHPETFNRWSRLYSPRVVPRVLDAARRIIAVSEFTKRELVEQLRVPPEKIRVVPNAVEPIFTRRGPAADGDYVLAVATIEPRKNLARIAEAARRAGVELRVAGAKGWGDIGTTGEGVHWLGEVSDHELARQYRGARCLVYASLYEGFGIPIIEAMASGLPVVTSRVGAMAEVGGGAAVLVDPNDASSIAEGIAKADAERASLVERGEKRARAFNWSDVAAATVAVYREAAA